MYGIVTLLDPATNVNMTSLWRELKLECGLDGSQGIPVPHFSWHIAAHYELDSLKEVIKTITKSAQPFMARTSGLGVFSGPSPVVYIALVKDEKLMRFHEILWQRTRHTGIDLSPLYAPEIWVPHITLAHSVLDGEALGCLMERLAFRPFKWVFPVDNLALIGQGENQQAESRFVYPFEG